MKRSEQTKWAELLHIQVDRAIELPVARQIYLQLRQSIVDRTQIGRAHV